MIHNILLVDDRPENLFSLEQMLEQGDRHFIKATSGNEALKIAMKENLSLILLDVQMPEMDGFETAEILQSNEKTKKVPIIFVTAINKETKYAQQGLETGAIDYLFKPLDTNITRSKVTNLLRLYQQQIELAEKNHQLALLNSEKNGLLGVAAHDLRNPLAVISTLSNFILEEYDERLPLDIIKCVSIINSSGTFMLELVNNLLDVAKIEEGKLTLHEEDIDLVELINMNIDVNMVLSEKKDIKIEFNPSVKELDISLDPGKIDQVLNNLISNAMKFSVSGTTITVSLNNENGMAKIAVADQGQGIPENELHKLFKPFQTTSVLSTAGETSTGLGLCIVKRIVEAHKGRIWVESTVGKGTTFYVTLPV